MQHFCDHHTIYRPVTPSVICIPSCARLQAQSPRSLSPAILIDVSPEFSSAPVPACTRIYSMISYCVIRVAASYAGWRNQKCRSLWSVDRIWECAESSSRIRSRWQAAYVRAGLGSAGGLDFGVSSAPRYGAYWLLARPCLARLLFEVSLAARDLDLPPHVNVDTAQDPRRESHKSKW